MRHATTIKAIAALEAERQTIYMHTNRRLLTHEEIARLAAIREALEARWKQRRAEQALARV